MQLTVVPHSSPLASNRACYFRHWYFSDLRWRNEKTGYVQHIHMPHICIGPAYAYAHQLYMLQLPGKLNALAFAAGQLRRELTQPQV